MTILVQLDDAIAAMKRLPDETIDMVYADPPYAISKVSGWKNTWNGYQQDKGDWDRVDGDYGDFTRLWLAEAIRLLRPGGIICISGVFGSLVPAFVFLEEQGLRFQSHLVWWKTNPAPSVHRRIFTHANELVVIFSKGANWTFNYDVLKERNGGKQQHNVVRLASCRKIAGIIRKPDALMDLLVLAFTNEGDTILDPFMGTGSMPLTANRAKRKAIGIDNNEIAFQAAKKRFGWE